MSIADKLSGPAKLEAIQWVLLSAAPRTVLTDQLKALLSAPNMLGPCHLRRARFKPGRKLTAHYEVLVHVEGAEGYGARPIAVTWRMDGDADRHQAGDDLAEMQAEAVRQGVAAPFRQLTAELPEWSMHIQVSPLDAQFPQLVRLSDPRYVRARLGTAYVASDLAPDQPRSSRYAVTSIRYPPRPPHALRYAPLDTVKA